MRDQDSMDSLFAAYADAVYRYALYTLGDPWDAADVVQEVFLRAFRSWDAVREVAHVKAWLFQIERNYLRDRGRRQKRRASEYLTADLPALSTDMEPESPWDLERALADLKPSYRDVVILRFIEDLSIEETAKVTGWTRSKVRSTQHRALEKLRELLRSSSGGVQ